ncbi:MAG: TolC family protein [Bacteroidetes bacterium]|nr:TolC family protein [Bacteroidota bacterium]
MMIVSNLFDSVVNRFYTDINDRVTDGLTPSNDLLQGKVRVNESALNLMQTKNAFEISKMELNNSMGRNPDEFVEVPDSILFYSQNSMMYSDTIQIDSVALDNRAEIDISQGQLNTSMLNEKITKADFYPTIGLSMSGRYGVPGESPDFNTPNFNFMGSVYLNYPIFQGNMRRNRVDASVYNTMMSGEMLEQQKKDVLLQVNKAAYSFQESIQKVELTQNSLSQAKQNLDAISTKYSEGLSPLSEVLDAQSFWLNAYSAYIQAKLENKVNLSSFQKALGLY